jgi:hypothetical protein
LPNTFPGKNCGTPKAADAATTPADLRKSRRGMDRIEMLFFKRIG